MLRRVLASFVAGLAVLACGDETTINNYNVMDTGIIFGSVTPIEEFTIVRLDSLVFVRVDSDGEFIFTDVPTGEHVITIEPITFSPRRLSNINVWPSQVLMIGKIELSTLPYPVYHVYPADGDSGVSTYKTGGIQLSADEPIDTVDLNTKTVIVPPVQGRWHGKSNGDREASYYTFQPDVPESPPGSVRYPYSIRIFRVGTTYNVKIDGSVRTALGAPLGRDIEVTFTTEPLSVSASIPAGGLEGGVRMTSFVPRLTFNDTVSIDSVARAVSFIPTLEGLWFVNEGGNECTFLPSGGPLPPSTDYKMIVSSEVTITSSARLGKPDTTEFTTEPVGVTSFYPCNGCSGSNYIRFEFNAPMNIASVESAFSLTSAVGDTIDGDFYWDSYSRPDRSMTFRPEPPLSGGSIYKMTLSQDASSADGYPIYQEVVSYFLAN